MKYYIERWIKNKLEDLATDPMSLVRENHQSINDSLCYGIGYLDYPSDDFPLNTYTLQKCYSPEIANFLLVLCENIGTTNCTSTPITLPSSFSSTYYILNIPDQKPNYGGIFYEPSSKTTFLVWSGTSNLKMSEEDIRSLPVPMPPYITSNSEIKVHQGFLSIYLKLRDNILDILNQLIPQSDYFVITGNSLGGGLSYISAFDLLGNNLVSLDTLLYTFGSPRAGNIVFANEFNTDLNIQSKLISNFRIYNTEDIVPTLPPSAPIVHYTHVGNSVPFTYNSGTVPKNHLPGYFGNIPENLTTVCP